MVGRISIRCLVFVGIMLFLHPYVEAQTQEPIRFRSPERTIQPITISADEIATWMEGNQRVLALSGKVFLQQGITEVRTTQGIVWIETDPSGKSTFSKLVFYADGETSFESGRDRRSATSGLIELQTVGEVKINSMTKKIVKESLANTPLYRAALASRGVLVEPKELPKVVSKNRVVEQPIVPAQFTQAIDPIPLPNNTPPEGSPYRPLPIGPSTIDPKQDNRTPPAPKGTMVPPTQIPLPNASRRQLFITPRSSTFQSDMVKRNGEDVIIVTGGMKFLAIFNDANQSILDIEADQLVFWTNGGTQELFGAMRGPTGADQGNDRQIELYMSGNVVIRYGNAKQSKNSVQNITLRAEQVYYDVSKNKALALNGDLEFFRPDLGVPAHVKANEIYQLSPDQWETRNTGLSASRLPSDPGLQVTVAEATILQQKTVRRSIFGIPFIRRGTGEEVNDTIRTFEGRNVAVEVGGIPIFYAPRLTGNVNDPFGPLQSIGFRQDRVFGTQLYTSFDVLELIGVTKLPDERWNLYLDYLSDRGPAAGTEYSLIGREMFGYDTTYATNVKLYGIYDKGHDRLGGPREYDFVPTKFRGRASVRHFQTAEQFTFQGQLSYLSDPRFYEQYYKYEFDLGPNQETFAHGKFQEGNLAATLLVESNFFRNWVSETEWLPKASGYWLGNSFFDYFTYNAWGSVGYAHLKPTEVPPFALLPTEQRLTTGRIDTNQELSLPFALGPIQIAPYGKVNLAAYSNDLTGNSQGRYILGGGARASMPLSRLYEGVDSELFNLHGLNHKIVFGTNYYTAYSNTPYSLLPQLDRLNDDALDQTVRDITPYQTTYVSPPGGMLLQTSPLFNPQVYAIRRLVDTRGDTLDTIQVVQADVRQRFQTKRGFPGMEHTVDWLTFDLSASFFPAANRDNFGKTISFIEYDTAWYVGDQTGLTSAGWFDPFDLSARYWNVGGFLNRPDRTRYYLGYRQTDPLGSKAVNGAMTYIFSPKYAFTASAVYDFGTSQALSNSVVITRVGTDLSVSFGLTYNAILNNFGVIFEIVPNLLAARSGGGGLLNAFGGAGNNLGARR